MRFANTNEADGSCTTTDTSCSNLTLLSNCKTGQKAESNFSKIHLISSRQHHIIGAFDIKQTASHYWGYPVEFATMCHH
jgi:hypothetical protein